MGSRVSVFCCERAKRNINRSEILVLKQHISHTYDRDSAFANSRPLQTDTFLFPLIHSLHVLFSSNKFFEMPVKFVKEIRYILTRIGQDIADIHSEQVGSQFKMQIL